MGKTEPSPPAAAAPPALSKKRDARRRDSRRIRVLVADDHAMVREGIVGILKGSGDIDVVGEAGDGAEATRKALETRPDVAVLDASMPRLSGLEATRRIREALPETRVLILTMHDEEEYLVRSLRAGASGYLVKDGAAAELLAGVHAVNDGQRYFAPSVAGAALRAAQAPPSTEDDPYERLTDRERDVFHLIVEGRTNAQIAAVLEISPKTVDNHRTRLMEKLGLHSAAELVRYAAKHQLVP
jgi:DNA-binding NarL/FixJ family response regulator